MQLPAITGVINRRVLVNYRVDPQLIQPLLPAPFRPATIDGVAIAGICLIRLEGVRPRRGPRGIGIASENAAHRVAVEWDEAGERRTGVYIFRRDTSSRLNAVAGGRLFPAIFHHARFDVEDTGATLRVAFESDETAASVAGSVTSSLPSASVFGSLDDASAFFADGAIGYSPARGGRLDGLELRTDCWNMTPLDVEAISSSFYDDSRRFPAGSIELDSALLMRDIPHEWCSCAAPG